MNPLGKEQMDNIAVRGCTMPGCDHQNHTKEVFLHGKCHLDEPTQIDIKGQVATISCRECYRTIVVLKLREPLQATQIKAVCHSKAGVWASYQWNAGFVEVFCAECRSSIARLDLADASASN